MLDLSWWQLLVMILAAARINRIVTEDVISEPVREWVETLEVRRAGGRVGRISLTTLINCHWCTGFWVGCGVAALTWGFGSGHWLWWCWIGLAVAQGSAMVNEREKAGHDH